MKKLLTAAILLYLIFLIFVNIRTNAQTLTLLLPTNNSGCQNMETRFDWQATNALKFDLQVSYTAGFNNLIVDERDLVASEFTTTLPTFDTSYYWRVSCTFTDLTTTLSNTWVFYTKQSAPTPILPANNATCLDTAFQFSWSTIPGATRYWLQISTNQDFSTTVYSNNAIPNTSIALSNFSFNTEYYWRVKSIKSNCESDWSTVFKFKTRQGPPMLVAPSNGMLLVPMDIVLKWTSSPVALTYNIQVATTADFDTLIVNQSDWTADTFQLSLTQYNKTYYWRVRGIYSDCQSNWSRIWYFKTPYQAPMLLEPEDSADCVHLRATYIWGAISGALSYRLQIAKDPGFSTIVRNIDKIGSNFVNVVLDSPLTTYYWHVRAEDSTNIGLWSVTQLFSTTIKEPALLVPANLSTGQPLNMNFNWTEGNSQELHSIQISKQANFIETVVDSSDLVNPNFSVTLPDYNTEYYWRVKSQYLNCSSTWSELRKFKTKISPPKLVNPDSGAIKQPLNIVFQWEPVTDADYYEINVSLNPSFTEIFQGTKGIQSNQILLKNFAPSTVYYWRVQAANEEGKSDWSTTFKFTTGKRGAEIPRLISPKSGSTLVPIDAKLVWFKSNDADRYIVQVSEDEYFSGFEFNRDDITDTSVTISGLEYYKRYFWRVAAINDSGQTRWSEEWNFRTTAQAPTDEPILIAPPDKLENTEIHLKFIWNAVPRADGYHLQISEDENFTENALFFNSDKVWATEANIYDMSYGTRYYWRVAGFNEAGKTDWSEVWSFTTKTSSGFKDEQMGNLVIRIIPNPVGEYATIELKAEEVYKINISIINIIGSASMNFGEFNLQSGQMTVPFNTKSLPDGFYYILITTQSQKFVLPFIVRK